jgi:hypothetical protein
MSYNRITLMRLRQQKCNTIENVFFRHCYLYSRSLFWPPCHCSFDANFPLCGLPEAIYIARCEVFNMGFAPSRHVRGAGATIFDTWKLGFI